MIEPFILSLIVSLVFKSFFFLLLQKEALLFLFSLQLGEGREEGLRVSQKQTGGRGSGRSSRPVGCRETPADCLAQEAPGGG